MTFVPTKECAAYPGYYHVPDNDIVAASPDVKFINLRTGRPIKAGSIYDGYWKISCHIEGKTHNWYVHRIMARTFIGRPLRHLDKDYSELEVNHRNGDKSDNSLSNLEWLTPSENTNHALDNFMTSYTPVLAKDILSGSVISFPTALACSKAFGISNRRLRKHLKSKEAGTRTKNWYVFKYADGEAWPVLRDKDRQQNTWDVRFGVWYAKHEATGKTYFNRTLQELCDALNLTYASVQTGLQNNTEKRYQGYIFWHDDRPVEDVVKGITTTKKVPEGIRAPMKIRVIEGEIETIYDSAIKASKALGVSQNTITYAIKTRGGKIKDSVVSYI